MAHRTTLYRRAQRSAKDFNMEVAAGQGAVEDGDCETARLAVDRAGQLLSATMHHYLEAGRPIDTKLWREWIRRYGELYGSAKRRCGLPGYLSD
jgi:hypothetical protein